MADDVRTKRAAALQEKKRRLDALKARRSGRESANASTNTIPSTGSNITGGGNGGSSTSAVSASAMGNLDDYIDGLLGVPAPMGVVESTTSNSTGGGVVPSSSSTTINTSNVNVATTATSVTSADNSMISNHDMGCGGSIGGGSSVGGNTMTAGLGGEFDTPLSPTSISNNVISFEFGTQTEEDDFPPGLQSDTSDSDSDDKDKKDNVNEEEDNVNNNINSSNNTKTTQVKMMNPNQASETMSSNNFANFFDGASRKVERLLGAPLLADLLIDDSRYDYGGVDGKNNGDGEEGGDGDGGEGSGGEKSSSYVSSTVSYSFPTWTAGRDIAFMDWSPHRSEMILASYHDASTSSKSSSSAFSHPYYSFSVGSSGGSGGNGGMGDDNPTTVGATVVRSITPNPQPSTRLLPQKAELRAGSSDGCILLWNLAMPSRPEHVLSCGSPLSVSHFHPNEPALVIGATKSGQVVVWDVREGGRLPVQRSTNSNSGMGHCHPVTSATILPGSSSTGGSGSGGDGGFGSGYTTVSTDGKVCYWSLSNLRDPAESLFIPGGNASAVAVGPFGHSLLVGDEGGGLHSVTGGRGTLDDSAGGVGATTASSKRTARKICSGATGDILGGDSSSSSSNNTTQKSIGHYGMITGISTKRTGSFRNNIIGTGSGSITNGFPRGSGGLVLTCGVDWTTRLWAPAHSDRPLLTFMSGTYDYMCDVQW